MKKILIIMLTIMAFIFSYPCIYILMGSFLDGPGIYVQLLIDTPQFWRLFWNSFFITAAVCVGQVIVGVPSAWGLARYYFPFRNVFIVLYILLMILPFEVMMLAEYITLSGMNLTDSLWAIVLPGIFSTFTAFIVYVSFRRIPNNILESARIDGASEWQILWNIGIPAAKESIISAMILTFLEYWNLVEEPMIFLQTKSKWPISMYMSFSDIQNLRLNFCVSVIALIPASLVFLAGEKYLNTGIITSHSEG